MSQVGGLARDVLTQRGGHVVAPAGDSAPPPAPRPVQSALLWQPPQASCKVMQGLAGGCFIMFHSLHGSRVF